MSDRGSERRIIPVILSGGAGKRLWPLSRAGRPKQLMAIAGAETLVQQTAARVDDRSRFQAPIVVAGADHADLVEVQLADIGVTPGLLIVEPCARNTAAAMALAALTTSEDDILLVLPSDHRIEDKEAFQVAIDSAAPFAAGDWLVTFGIAPDRPEPGYGHITRGAMLSDDVYRVDGFVEKPHRDFAEILFAQGGHDWNAGIFLFRAGALIAALADLAPEILAACRASVASSRREAGRLFPDPQAFAASPALSIDTAVMELSDHVAVVPVEMGWSDVGSWDSLYELGVADSERNVVSGDVLAVDSHGCLVQSDGPTIITIGVRDLIVIATGDSVLIVPRGQSQRVKDALDELESKRQKARDSES